MTFLDLKLNKIYKTLGTCFVHSSIVLKDITGREINVGEHFLLLRVIPEGKDFVHVEILTKDGIFYFFTKNKTDLRTFFKEV